jgi:hypothetical protein
VEQKQPRISLVPVGVSNRTKEARTGRNPFSSDFYLQRIKGNPGLKQYGILVVGTGTNTNINPGSKHVLMLRAASNEGAVFY